MEKKITSEAQGEGRKMSIRQTKENIEKKVSPMMRFIIFFFVGAAVLMWAFPQTEPTPGEDILKAFKLEKTLSNELVILYWMRAIISLILAGMLVRWHVKRVRKSRRKRLSKKKR